MLTAMAFRNISRNRRRSILSAIAIAVSALAIVFAFSLMNGLLSDLVGNVQNFVSGDIRIRHRDFDTYEYLTPLHLSVVEARNLQQQVEALPEVASAVTRISFPAVMYLSRSGGSESSESIPLQGIGVDFIHEERYQELSSLLRNGRLPNANSNEALIGSGFASRNNLIIGDSFTVLTTTRTRGSNAFTLEIVGIAQLPYNSLDSRAMLIPYDRAQYFLRMEEGATEILVKRAPSSSEEEALAAVNAVLEGPSEARSWRDIGLAFTYIQTATISYAIIALIFFLLASTVIVNTTMMVIFERIREIGTLSAMGMNPRTLVRLFFIEALFISIIGALCGALGGTLLSAIFGNIGIDFTNQLQGVDFEISNIIYPRPTALISLLVFLYSVVVSALATLLPSTRSARIRPVEALRRV